MILSKTSQLTSQVNEGKTVGLSFHIHNRQILKFINSLFSKILSRNDIIFLQKTVETVVREMIVNAEKANLKRIHFQNQDLDINIFKEYSRGMETFRSVIDGNLEFVQSELKNSNYKVKLFVKKVDKGLKIVIQNNVPLHPIEANRINIRIEKAKSYNSFSDVYQDVTDDVEGEGLGIILIILFLRNSGIGEDSFKVTSDRYLTQSTLTIPYKLKPVTITTQIQKQIYEEVDEIPTFPENIIELQKLCSNPDVSIQEIVDRIVLDPSITSSVLRLSNSAGFITRKRIENINEAVMIIGFENLNAILIASSARKIMDERYSMFKQVWNHCNKTAFYCRNIALQYGLENITDKVFLSGLLHDLGKIILLSTNSELSNWISDITMNREIRTTTIIEEISIGVSHSSIGELIADKWRMPEYLIESIKYHHSPLDASKEYKEVVYITYLANMLCGIEENRYDFLFLEEDVLNMFKFTSEEKFQKLHNNLKNKYNTSVE